MLHKKITKASNDNIIAKPHFLINFYNCNVWNHVTTYLSNWKATLEINVSKRFLMKIKSKFLIILGLQYIVQYTSHFATFLTKLVQHSSTKHLMLTFLLWLNYLLSKHKLLSLQHQSFLKSRFSRKFFLRNLKPNSEKLNKKRENQMITITST